MLSSRFLVVGFLYLSYVTHLVAADHQYDKQTCENVRTVTVVQTVTHTPPPSNSQPPNHVNAPPPVVTQHTSPNVNLGSGNDHNKNGNTDPNNAKNNNSKSSSTGTLSTNAHPPPSSTAPPSTGNNKANGNSGNGKSNNGDPSTSLTLDPSVIQKVNGKSQAAGEIDSLVSSNNFINFCAGKTLTRGLQVKEGSCNPTPMGDIPSKEKMPSAKFNSPRNFDTISADTSFTISIQINNLATGTFTDATNTYYAAPQQLVDGIIKGHSHVAVQKMQSLSSTQPLDPKTFAFFKGLNDVGKNGVLTATLTNGLSPGVYRISSINSAGNHQEVSGPVAQRGSFNDVIYITVKDGSGSNPVKSSPNPTVKTKSPSVSPTSSDKISSVSSTSSTLLPSNSDGTKNGKNQKQPRPNDSSSVSTPYQPVPTGADGQNNNGKNDDGQYNNGQKSNSQKNNGQKNGGQSDGGKKGDPTSTSLSETPTSTAGGGQSDPQGSYNGPYRKRMHKRSLHLE